MPALEVYRRYYVSRFHVFTTLVTRVPTTAELITVYKRGNLNQNEIKTFTVDHRPMVN